jgi:serine/threonine-protein kinase
VSEIATTIPGYRIIKSLGVGRTAHVYLAVDEKTGRQVALKIPKPEVLKEPVFARMFANEIMLSRGLDHAHIVHCFDGVASGSFAHLAMRYVPGGPLEDTELAQNVIYRVMADVASALEYLHARRIVHQDIKPANVYVAEGRGYLADFGAASNETAPGAAAGSPFYMAPEIFQGLTGSAKSDVYSFGVVLYELLSGLRPIVGETYEHLQAAHLARVPAPIRSIAPDVPKTLSPLIDRALSKNPAQRPTMTEFKNGLESLLARPAVAQPVSEPEPPKPNVGRATSGGTSVRIEKGAMRVKEEPKGLFGRLFKKR